MHQRSDNLESHGEAGSGNCSVCRDLLAHMERFFSRLQIARGAPESDWLTVDDISAELKVSKSIVYRLIRSGEIEAVNTASNTDKTGRKGHYRVKRSSLDKYLQLNTVRIAPRIGRRSGSSGKSLPVKDHLGI